MRLVSGSFGNEGEAEIVTSGRPLGGTSQDAVQLLPGCPKLAGFPQEACEFAAWSGSVGIDIEPPPKHAAMGHERLTA